MLEKIKKHAELLFFLAIFIYLMLFFSSIHPIMISDTDDWYYTYLLRKAIPIPHSWNPARVLPEIMMPTFSFICSRIIGFITHDFFIALTIGYAFIVSASVTLLFYLFYKLVLKRWNNNWRTGLFVILTFLIGHFWIFRSSDSNNYYMLWSLDATTYFYYVLPNIYNCALVVWLFAFNDITFDFFKNEKLFSKSIFILTAYLLLFSNVWSSAITASYVGGVLLWKLVKSLRSFNFIEYIRNNYCYITYILLWTIVVHKLEAGGVRGNGQLHSSLSLIGYKIVETVQYFIDRIGQMNKAFVVSTSLIIILGIVIMIVDKYKKKNELLIIFISMILCVLYDVLSCAIVNPQYVQRPDILYGVFFFWMFLVLWCSGYLLNRFYLLKMIAPLILFIALFECNTSYKTFRESNVLNLETSEINAINRDIVYQLEMACQNGEDNIVIYVPDFEDEDNWPYALYANERFAEALYKNGYLDRRVNVTEMIPSVEKNIELGLSIE